MGVFLLEENSTLTYTRKDDHHENKNFVIIFLHISWSSVFQQYHRTKIWISSHQKWSFELENNILALNMIDITVMSSQTNLLFGHRPITKMSMPICIELTFTNALWLHATRVSASYDDGIGMFIGSFLTFWRTNKD